MTLLSRAEADALMSELEDAESEYRSVCRLLRPYIDPRANALVDTAFAKYNACRERVLDAICQEERTEPLAGFARDDSKACPYCGRPKGDAICQASHP